MVNGILDIIDIGRYPPGIGKFNRKALLLRVFCYHDLSIDIAFSYVLN